MPNDRGNGQHEPTPEPAPASPAGGLVHQLLEALHLDHVLSSRDQTSSEADQGSSDADQAGSVDDQGAAAADQRASDSDQAAADEAHAAHDDLTPEEEQQFQRSRKRRDDASAARDHRGLRRGETAEDRDHEGIMRDVTADARDDVAQARDDHADKLLLAAADAHGDDDTADAVEPGEKWPPDRPRRPH
jgi:hypothetical protein